MVRIFDDERIAELKNLKLVITVYPTEKGWINHWYLDTNGQTEEQFRLSELYAILCSISDVEDGVEKLFQTLHENAVEDNDDNS